MMHVKWQVPASGSLPAPPLFLIVHPLHYSLPHAERSSTARDETFAKRSRPRREKNKGRVHAMSLLDLTTKANSHTKRFEPSCRSTPFLSYPRWTQRRERNLPWTRLERRWFVLRRDSDISPDGMAAGIRKEPADGDTGRLVGR